MTNKLLNIMIIALLVAGAAFFKTMLDASKMNATLKQVQKSNDSLTKVLVVTLKHVDSLQLLVVSETNRADSFSTLAAATSSKIAAVETKRKKIPNYIKQLPDTGVAREFGELLR